MAITVTTQPYSSQYKGNPNLWTFMSDAVLASAGTKFLLLFTPLWSVGETLTLSWEDGQKQAVFNIVASPTNNGSDLPNAGAGNATIVTYFNQSYPLTNDFTITVFGIYIEIKAKRAGVEYNITTSGTATFTVFSSSLGTAKLLRQPFEILTDLYVSPSWNTGQPVRVGLFAISMVDNNTEGSIDLSDPVKSYIEYKKPLYFQNVVTIEKFWVDYFLKYCERYKEVGTNTQTHTGVTTSSTKRIVAGRLPQDIYWGQNTDWLTYWATNKKWHTHAPTTHYVDQKQHQYLYYYNQANYTSIDIELTVFWNDGTPPTTYNVWSIALTGKDFICVPVGPNQIDVDAFNPNPGTTLATHYRVRLMSGATEIAVPHTFFIDSFGCAAKYFLFRNTMGVFETIRCISNLESDISHDRQAYQKPFVPNQMDSAGNLEIVNEMGSLEIASAQSFKMRTGIMPPEWVAYYAKDFIGSEEVYEIDMKAGKYIPIVITNTKTTLPEQTNPVLSIAFEYRYAHTWQDKTAVAKTNTPPILKEVWE